MRFRYFDSEGTEVEISSVDALKFRMTTGAITPETLLYDAAVGKWAPAGRHQVYRFLVEEGDDVLPAASREMWEEMEDEQPVVFASDPGEVRSEEKPELPLDPDRRERTAGPSREADVEDPGPGATPPEKDDDGEEEETAVEPDDQLFDLDEVEPLPEREDADPAGPPRGGDAPSPADSKKPEPEMPEEAADDDLRATAPEVGKKTVPAGNAESAEPPRPSRRPSGHPGIREVDIPARLVSRSTASADAGSRSDGEKGGGSWFSSKVGLSGRMRWAVLLALFLFGGGALLVHLVEARADGLLADGADTAMDRTVPGPAVASMTTDGAMTVSDRGPEGGPGEDRVQPLPEEELESLVSEVAGAVSLDLARAMGELQEALGVTERPPEAWLHGAYLAEADRHPEVREYWRAYGAYVASVRALEEELYRGFVQNRVLKMGLDTASAAGLSARILERYEGSAEKRDVVYDDLATLAEEALALHDTLALRSESISYEPFSGRSLSRDPVVEAVADDPELAEHIWSRMDRIFELLDRIQGVQPVSTLRLQDALLSGLRIPERADGEEGSRP